jgi:predicted regulator of Ras-like GTPase activity (Roadblock/LC7/MglB family)
MPGDEGLRAKRVVFYKDTIDQIEALLDEFLKLTKARSVFFIDKEGHLITNTGESTEVNPETLSALIAGSFAATRELARVLGESQFNAMSHKGAKDSVSMMLVGSRSILAVLFDQTTTAGMVDLYCKELTQKIARILDIAEKQSKLREKETLLEGYQESVQERLDELFED